MAVLCIDYGYRLANSPIELTRPQINFLIAALNQRYQAISSLRTQADGVTKFVFSEEEE